MGGAVQPLRGPVPLVVTEERLERRSDAVLVMPTYRKAEVTAATLKEVLALNPPDAFDVLLVDNGGGDIETVRAALDDDPRLNYIVLAENTGPSGALYLGQMRAYEAGYEALIMSDNDTRLLTENGLALMLAKLPADGFGAVAPTIATQEPQPDHFVVWADWEYFVLGRAAFERIGPVDPAYFFGFEDADYIARVVSAKVPILRTGDVRTLHPFRKPVTFYNFTTYGVIRGHCIFLFGRRPSHVAWRFRAFSFVHLIAYTGARLLSGVVDPTIPRAVMLGFRDGRRERIRHDMPANRFVYESVPCDGSGRFHDLASLRARLIPRKRFVATNPLTGERLCYERRPARSTARGAETRYS